MTDDTHQPQSHRWTSAVIDGLDALLAALDAGETIRG